MQVIPWKSEITADWARALVLTDLRYKGSLCLELEEESGKRWLLEFKSVQAWKVTAEECAGSIMTDLPNRGALFKVEHSNWRHQLGNATPLEKSQHFVVCCYDEVVEVLAWDCLVTMEMK